MRKRARGRRKSTCELCRSPSSPPFVSGYSAARQKRGRRASTCGLWQDRRRRVETRRGQSPSHLQDRRECIVRGCQWHRTHAGYDRACTTYFYSSPPETAGCRRASTPRRHRCSGYRQSTIAGGPAARYR
ncbi:hypothetical protein MA20_44510 [Bradyrhizobium japonicum]|uniref:Uncharacterized protein n=1 Tax=Bradyrhizobium japonicum TaxID=375 RepID=A0A0A3XGJ2_BRAJP|nr:hypothetical protein MA20_44510 [Bradyrhizobium japonicum]